MGSELPGSLERRDWCQLEAGEGILHVGGLPCLSLQWDLVCQQRGLNKLTSTCFFIGVLVGAVVYGYLSDR